MTGYNNILLPDKLPWRMLSKTRLGVDFSLLVFLVEELIARSALTVAVPDSSFKYLAELPAPFRKRVIQVDEEKATRRAGLLLQPFTEEFGTSFGDHAATSLTFERGLLPVDLYTPMSQFFRHVRTFLIGIEHGLQIDLDPKLLQGCVDRLRRKTRNPEGRAILVSMQGILETYRSQDVPGLICVSTARPELIDVFNELIDDQVYKELCSSAYDLGFADRIDRAKVLLRRGSKSLLSKTPFKQLFKLGTRIIESATSIPLPDSGAVRELLKGPFLPPFIDLETPMFEAARAWARFHPEASLFGFFPKRGEIDLDQPPVIVETEITPPDSEETKGR